jgi:hypothetical protein
MLLDLCRRLQLLWLLLLLLHVVIIKPAVIVIKVVIVNIWLDGFVLVVYENVNHVIRIVVTYELLLLQLILLLIVKRAEVKFIQIV